MKYTWGKWESSAHNLHVIYIYKVIYIMCYSFRGRKEHCQCGATGLQYARKGGYKRARGERVLGIKQN